MQLNGLWLVLPKNKKSLKIQKTSLQNLEFSHSCLNFFIFYLILVME